VADTMIKIEQILTHAKEQGATDIHISTGAPILFRIGRDLVPVTQDRLTAELSRELSLALLSDEQREKLDSQLDYDLMVADEDRRYRINIGYFRGTIGVIIRILPERPGTIEELKLPFTVKTMAYKTKGLVLITGSTSQGKTTTMASMIDEINTNCKKHVVTIEDPIEYLHENKLGIVRQREVGKDTRSFSQGLRAALRQDPDVIAIGEMRDYETIKIALTAAETGILVLSTLHTISIDKMIERLLSYTPADEESHIRYVLADTLQAAIHQELVPTIDGGKRIACEVLTATDATRNIMRRKGTFMLRNLITTGKKYGMITMNDSLEDLLREQVITEDVASAVMSNYRT
jgi:twitching motility protein PilT